MSVNPNPLRFGSDAQFALVRRYLLASGYQAENICERLGVERLGMFEGLQPRTEAWTQRDALNALISLFALGENVSEADFEVLPGEVRESLYALGLVDAFATNRIYSPVAIGPVEDLYFVSDRWCSPDGSPFQIADDAVYPAITPNTLKFLDTVPLVACEALLDVGTGTGVGALLGAARYAERACAVDITQRSAKFTEFNCRLNAITNVDVGEGDLYEPVGSQTFDRIIAHPPYVPVLSHHWTFHDGGDDGELLTRRLIQGLPRYLRAGGVFHCYAMGSDRDLPFEQRIREWLGASHAEFDVQLIVKNQMEPMQFGVQSVLKHDGANQDLGLWKKLFEKNHVRNLVFGTITVRRFVASRDPLTIRRLAGPQSSRAEAEWLWTLESSLNPARVLAMRPLLARALELDVRHAVQQGQFAVSTYAVRASYPFQGDAEIPGWAAVLLGRCKGQSTTQQLLDELKAEGYLKPQVSPADFAELVRSFLVRGFLEASEFPLPR